MFSNVRNIARREKPARVVQTLVDAMAVFDADTCHHGPQTAALAARIALHLDLDAATVENCRLGALLHDVGMLGIDPQILRYPSMLSDPDYDVVVEHPELGEELLMSIPTLTHLGPIVRGHHERIDGTGYPDGLAGNTIPIEARIIAVADAFHVMTVHVPYRGPLPMAAPEAMAELFGNANSQFDLAAVSACDAVIGSHAIRFGRA